MKHKILLLSTLCLCLGLVNCSSGDKFVVSGHISDASDRVLYLDYLGLDGVHPIDSIKLPHSGLFTFEQPAPEYPEYYRLRLGKQFIPFAIDSVRKLNVTSDARNFATVYNISGSKDAMLIKEIWLAQLDVNVKISDLVSQYNRGQVTIEELLAGKEEAAAEYKKVANKYIFNTPVPPVAYFALFQQVGKELIFSPYDKADSKSFAVVANIFEAYYPESPRTKHLYNLALNSIAVVRAQEQRDRDQAQADSLLKRTTSTPIGYVDIDLPDLNDQAVKLSSVAQGHYTLLSFTSMATEWSGHYNKGLATLYERFGDKGLRIYQVGFDEDTHIWKNTVKHLPWINVQDKNGVYSQLVGYYNLSSIPALFVINKEGVIEMRVKTLEDVDAWLSKRLP